MLAPAAGTITLDGDAVRAMARAATASSRSRRRTRIINGAARRLREDVARRRSALARYSEIAVPDEAALATLAALLGVRSLDQHLYELPLVARKRLSWLWPLSGALPWIMLDEPTIGQDRATRAALADAISRLAALGHGVVFITHDDEFAGAVAHRALRIAERTISAV